MAELSIFIDESGDLGEVSAHYLLALIFHEQDADISQNIERYELSLSDRTLDRIPMHVNPLINGNDNYRNLSKETRSRMLSVFRVFAMDLPFTYRCIAYKKSELGKQVDKFSERAKRDIEQIVNGNLAYFQSFDSIKIYYDNGQSEITSIIRKVFAETLFKDAIMHRNADPEKFYLLQVADYVCTLELTEIKYQKHAETSTDRIFFGTHATFRKNFLKRLRKHLL